MKYKVQVRRTISILLASIILFTSCASSTMILSDPEGAKVYLDGEAVGETPYSHGDTKIVGSCIAIRLEKEGYEHFYVNMCRNEEVDVGAIIGGIFFLFPFLWTMKYKPNHRYELIPVSNLQTEERLVPASSNLKSKADKLRELKKLLDEDVLSQEEYDEEKKKVLEEK